MIELANIKGIEVWTTDYDHAFLYCLFFEQQGSRGWRLPTVSEYHLNDSIPVSAWVVDTNGTTEGIKRIIQPVRTINQS